MGSISRRSFLVGSALTAGAFATLGITGCAPKEAQPMAEDGAAGAANDTAEVRTHAAHLNPQTDQPEVANGTCPSLFTKWSMGSLELPNLSLIHI